MMEDYAWLRVLCVEDEKDARELYLETLQMVFPNVKTASNGAEGLEIFKEWQPQIVLSDIKMPVMNGIDFSREVKALNRETIIIIASAHSESQYLFDAIQIGVDGFINKPVKMKQLIERIKIYAQAVWQREAYLSTKLLLEEYRDAVDETMLVSKTDINDEITYVNDAFCQISGYKREELIGKNHKIMRHPDMPKSTFAEMWETIKAKKTWKGVLKNLTKDGKTYIVDVAIKPILDKSGEVMEFIAMRRDITEQEEYRSYLQKQLGTKDSDLREKLFLLSQYEAAIEMSTAFCRSDMEGRLTSVNETFCQITGYKKEDVIGKKKQDIIDESNIACVPKERDSVWKGCVAVRCPDESVKRLSSTIVPIYDVKNSIQEYIAISHDITQVVELKEEVEATQREFFYSLGEMAELRSKETGQHVKRVAKFSALLAKKAGLKQEQIELIELASPMHDAGKIAIPDMILNKPGKLTDDEFEVMKTHAEIGHEMFKSSKREVLQAASLIALTHHEKWDGSGYPRGLCRDAIPFFGRIVAIADVYDALGCDRVYKKAWEQERIISFFKEQRGSHFDPALTDLFLSAMDEVVEIKEMYAD